MSEHPETRIFHCPHCQTGIQIPYNLPPTSAPCPKCGQQVTSPALEASAPVSQPEPVAPAPQEPAAPVLEPASKQGEEDSDSGQSGGGRLKLVAIAAGVIALLLLVAAALKIFLPSGQGNPDSSKSSPGLTPEERRDNAYRSQGWIVDTEAVLEQFFQAETIEERAALTIRGSQNEAEMAAVYSEFDEDGHRTPVSVFSPVSLSDQDTKRGIFLMTYNRPEQFAIRSFFRPIPPMRVKYGLEEPDDLLMSEAAVNNFVDRSLKVMAFFSRTPQGMKLDWQTYAQTKYRLLESFVSQPEPGRKGVFRVFVQEDIDLNQRDSEGYSVYRMSDPANKEDFAKVLVKDDSELGEALSPLKWRNRVVSRAPLRNATVSLVWSDEENPKLQMGELICWEFLGLGGERGNWKVEKDTAGE